MKICYFGTYRKDYSRNKIMIASLRAAGAEVIECHVPLWTGIEDRVAVTSGGWRSPKFWSRVIKTYRELANKIKTVETFDVLMLGYPGQFDTFLAKRIALRRQVPLVLDIFMSPYLVACERQLEKKPGSFVKALRFIEKIAYRKPDLMFQDTQAYADWLTKEFGIPQAKIILIPTSADETMFFPVPEVRQKNEFFEVLYYGTFIPNHGLDKILEAAKRLLPNAGIHFTFVGSGPLRPMVKDFITTHNLTNITLIDWLAQKDLNLLINKVDLCLGAFGDTPQSLMTIQNKIYECMAAGAAVLTGESPAILSSLNNGEVFCCERNAVAIADSIIRIDQDTDALNRTRIFARKRFSEDFLFSRLGDQMITHLDTLIPHQNE